MSNNTNLTQCTDLQYFEVNYSLPEEFHKQTNNKRFPDISCFPTSMINVAKAMLVPIPKDRLENQKYTQLEDIYDAFIYSPENVEYCKNNNPNIKWGIQNNINLREMYEMEVLSFNRWVRKNICTMNWGITPDEFLTNIKNRNLMVVGGKFNKLNHMIGVVGIKGYYSNNKNKIKWDLDKTKVIIDDSYGDPHKGYKSPGVNGNDIEYEFNDLWSKLKGSAPNTRLAVVFSNIT